MVRLFVKRFLNSQLSEERIVAHLKSELLDNRHQGLFCVFV